MNLSARLARKIFVLSVLVIVCLSGFALAESYTGIITEDSVQAFSDAALLKEAFELSKGDVVIVSNVSDGVASITYRTKTGFCKPDAIEDIAGKTKEAHVSASGAKVYSKPKTSSKSRSIAKDTLVNVISVSGDWAYVEKDGVGAFIYEKNITYVEVEATPEPTATPIPDEITKIPATVSADKLPVYKRANASSEKLGTLKQGVSVNVAAYNDKWAYIEKDGNYGYCKVSGLKLNEPEPTPSASPTPSFDDYTPAVVSANSVKVYAKASTTSKKLGTLKKGATLNVVSYDKTWAYVEKDGKFGYCKVKALSEEEPIEDDDTKYRKKYPDVQFTATVIYEYAPVFAGPSASSAKSKLALATQVDVYAYNDNWAYIGVDDARGFVQAKYLSAANYDELTSGSTGDNVTKLQKELEKLGYFDGIPGGNFGTLTYAAVKRFQSSISADETGVADTATQRVLYGGYAPESVLFLASLKQGDEGTNVERVQGRLYYLDYFSSTSSIDADYGETTVAAVKLFQQQAGLTVDGIATQAVIRAMYQSGAPTLPSGVNPPDYTAPSNPSKGVTTMPKGLASTTTSLKTNASNAEKLEYVIYLAQNQLGKPYIYGTAGPNSFDCSGYTTYCFRFVNVSLGRSAYAQGYQSSSGIKIESMSDLRRGDIVCFNTIADSDLVDHVGLYIGNGYFLHASSGTSNGRQVVVSELTSGYYNRVFSWGRRPLQ